MIIDTEPLLKEFPEDFKEMLLTNSAARMMFDLLRHGESPYQCIYHLAKMNKNQFDTLCEIANQSTPKAYEVDIEQLKNWITPEQLFELKQKRVVVLKKK